MLAIVVTSIAFPPLLPAALAGSAFGPRLQAAVMTMTARNRVSRRDTSELASELFQIGLSVGSVDAICQRVAVALTEPHERLQAVVLSSPAVNRGRVWLRTPRPPARREARSVERSRARCRSPPTQPGTNVESVFQSRP